MDKTNRFHILLVTFLILFSSLFTSCAISSFPSEDVQLNFDQLLGIKEWKNSGHYLYSDSYQATYSKDTIYKIPDESTIVQHFDFYKAIPVSDEYSKGELLYTLDMYYSYRISNYFGDNFFYVDFYPQSYIYKDKEGNAINDKPIIAVTPKNLLNSHKMQFAAYSNGQYVLGIQFKKNEKYDEYFH